MHVIPNLTLQEALINKELKRSEFDVAFCKKIKLLVDRLSSFFAKCRSSVEKMMHQKTYRSYRMSKIVKSRQNYITMAICPALLCKKPKFKYI